MATIRTYSEIANEIQRRRPRLGGVRLVAVDGPGGAGKSTLARRLAAALGGATILQTDDFASWEVPHEWWPRLERDALGPIAEGRPVRYRRYDWATRALGEWHAPEIRQVVVLEGVSSSRLAVSDRLSYSVWIETPRDLRLARGIDRDGADARDQWETWMAEEDAFFTVDHPWERADLVVDGAPASPHDPERQVVTIVLAPDRTQRAP